MNDVLTRLKVRKSFGGSYSYISATANNTGSGSGYVSIMRIRTITKEMVRGTN
uniref:Uncharacterized protein n=1 Tax=viral metagenome TaxID=1070528 RepID=A0A6C0BRJ0_9ZZZZ